MIVSFEDVRRDLAYTLRAFRRKPIFVGTIVATAALGIGANAAIYTVLERVFLRAPPGVPHPFELRRLAQQLAPGSDPQGTTRDIFSYSEFAAIRRAVVEVAEVAGYATTRERTSALFASDAVVAHVTTNYFKALGVRPLRGRWFVPDELTAHTADVAVISGAAAERWFGSLECVGQIIRVRGTRLQIVGVTDPDFQGLDLEPTSVWIPFVNFANDAGTNAMQNSMDLRLKIIVRISQSLAPALTSAAADGVRTSSGIGGNSGTVVLFPLAKSLGPRESALVGGRLSRLAIAGALLLLLAASNVAGLMIIRAGERRHEIAIRWAVGMEPHQLFRQLLTEGVVLGLFAGLVALGVGAFAGRALARLILPEAHLYGRPISAVIGIAAVTTSCVVASLASIVPLYVNPRTAREAGLREDRLETTPRRRRLRSMLLVCQTAFAVVLLALAALMVRSFRELVRAGTGYNGEGVFVATLRRGSESPSNPATAQFLTETARRILGAPGVSNVALSSAIPSQTANSAPIYVADKELPLATQALPTVLTTVSPGYFATLGIHLAAGREFSDQESERAHPVAIISSRGARLYWPGESALGKCLIIGRKTDPCRTIVGIVDDVRLMQLVESTTVSVYLPIAQAWWPPRALFIRTAPQGVHRGATSIARFATGGDSLGWDVRPFSSLFEPQLRPWRISAVLFSSLGILAICVAGVGAFGLMAQVARERSHELAIRRAMGARPAHLLYAALAPAVGLVIAGVVLGCLATLFLGRAVRALLYNVPAADPIALAAAATGLLAVACIASIGPALFTLNVDPATALRGE